MVVIHFSSSMTRKRSRVKILLMRSSKCTNRNGFFVFLLLLLLFVMFIMLKTSCPPISFSFHLNKKLNTMNTVTKRYHEILFMVDTCQAASLYSGFFFFSVCVCVWCGWGWVCGGGRGIIIYFLNSGNFKWIIIMHCNNKKDSIRPTLLLSVRVHLVKIPFP